MLLSLALAQAVSAAPPERVDLTMQQPCQPQSVSGDEVVVCANRDGASPYRLKQPPQQATKQLSKAEAEVARGVSVAAETEQTEVGGFPSNRAMFRLKIKF